MQIGAGSMEKLAVENLEGYPVDFISPVVNRVPVSRCVDIGHLWLDGIDPAPYLQSALPRTRVIHLHGIAERDHCSLAFMPQEKVQIVLRELIRANYQGVLTLEMFSQDDFLSSLGRLKSFAMNTNPSPNTLTLILAVHAVVGPVTPRSRHVNRREGTLHCDCHGWGRGDADADRSASRLTAR